MTGAGRERFIPAASHSRVTQPESSEPFAGMLRFAGPGVKMKKQGKPNKIRRFPDPESGRNPRTRGNRDWRGVLAGIR